MPQIFGESIMFIVSGNQRPMVGVFLRNRKYFPYFGRKEPQLVGTFKDLSGHIGVGCGGLGQQILFIKRYLFLFGMLSDKTKF